jgi:hypothetical protein
VELAVRVRHGVARRVNPYGMSVLWGTVPHMTKRAGGAAQRAPDIEDKTQGRIAVLTEELAAARLTCVEASARMALLCKVPGADPGQLADAAEAASLAAARVAGFARLLSRENAP